MSLSVFLYQSLHSHLPPPLQSAFIKLSSSPCSSFFFCPLLSPFVWLPVRHQSLLISVLDVCLLLWPSINQSPLPSFIHATSIVVRYIFYFLPDSCQNDRAFYKKGEKCASVSAARRSWERGKVLPWMLKGLSMTKLPFHTTERSTGRSLMSLPS